jgi:hypothetical protein
MKFMGWCKISSTEKGVKPIGTEENLAVFLR